MFDNNCTWIMLLFLSVRIRRRSYKDAETYKKGGEWREWYINTHLKKEGWRTIEKWFTIFRGREGITKLKMENFFLLFFFISSSFRLSFHPFLLLHLFFALELYFQVTPFLSSSSCICKCFQTSPSFLFHLKWFSDRKREERERKEWEMGSKVALSLHL